MKTPATKLCDILTNYNVNYKAYTHQAVFTINDVLKANLKIPGIGTKSLFLKDKSHNKFLLLTTEENKKIDLKGFAHCINSKHISFGSHDELLRNLGLEEGCVSPLGIINNTHHDVIVYFDKVLIGKKNIQVSANTHTTTLTIDFDDLLQFIRMVGNKVYILAFDY